MAAPRAELGTFLDLSDAEERRTEPDRPKSIEDIFRDAAAENDHRREHAEAEAAERGLWCYLTRQDDLAWHRLTRLERDAMVDAVTHAIRR